MRFNKHFELAGRHAVLSPSNYHWINYDLDKMAQVYMTQRAAARGTALHELAHDLIRLGVKLPRTQKTLNMYVNDCIGWKMIPEQMLFYSDFAFGTADAISFRKNVLRISDLKTGEHPAKPTQLEVYAAFFCLEYQLKPFELDGIELRIYQTDECFEYVANPVDIALIMDKTITYDKLIRQIREEEDAL
jgi:hypothetical protein